MATGGSSIIEPPAPSSRYLYQCQDKCNCGNCEIGSDSTNWCNDSCLCKKTLCQQCNCFCWAALEVKSRDDWNTVPAILSTNRDKRWPKDVLPLDLNRWRHILATHAPGANVAGKTEFPESENIAHAISETLIANNRTPGPTGEIWVDYHMRNMPIRVVLRLDEQRFNDGIAKYTVTAHPNIRRSSSWTRTKN